MVMTRAAQQQYRRVNGKGDAASTTTGTVVVGTVRYRDLLLYNRDRAAALRLMYTVYDELVYRRYY